MHPVTGPLWLSNISLNTACRLLFLLSLLGNASFVCALRDKYQAHSHGMASDVRLIEFH